MFDPPYFNKLADRYSKESISCLSRKEYLEFFREFLPLAREHSRAEARIAFLNADWRDFQGVSAMEENPARSICIDDYIGLLKRAGWEITHIIDAPLSLRAVGFTSRRPPNDFSQGWLVGAEKPNPRNRPALTDHRKNEITIKHQIGANHTTNRTQAAWPLPEQFRPACHCETGSPYKHTCLTCESVAGR